MKTVKILVSLVILTFSYDSMALRCNSKIVSVGDSTYKFFSLCGEPDFVEKRTAFRKRSVTERHIIFDEYPLKQTSKTGYDARRSASNRANSLNRINKNPDEHQLEYSAEEIEEVQIEEWIYDFGPHRLVQQIVFLNGVAIKINDLGYGVNK